MVPVPNGVMIRGSKLGLAFNVKKFVNSRPGWPLNSKQAGNSLLICLPLKWSEAGLCLRDGARRDGSFPKESKESKERNFAAFSSTFAVGGNNALVDGQKVLLLRGVSLARRFSSNTCGFPFLRYHEETSLLRTSYRQRRGRRQDAQKEVLKKLKIEKPVESRFLLREYFQGGELGRFTSARRRKV